jgi:hypothetical protein
MGYIGQKFQSGGTRPITSPARVEFTRSVVQQHRPRLHAPCMSTCAKPGDTSPPMGAIWLITLTISQMCTSETHGLSRRSNWSQMKQKKRFSKTNRNWYFVVSSRIWVIHVLADSISFNENGWQITKFWSFEYDHKKCIFVSFVYSHLLSHILAYSSPTLVNFITAGLPSIMRYLVWQILEVLRVPCYRRK